MSTSRSSGPDEPPVTCPRSTASLRILATTDVHMHLYGYDYHRAQAAPGLGLGRAAALVGALRAEVANSLLFDNGDFLQGSALADFVALDRGLRPGEMHPAIAAMNRLGYDAATLGNHEFNYGLPFLEQALAGAAFPVVCANLVRRMGATPQLDTHLVPPWTLIDRQVLTDAGGPLPLRVGVLGLLPPQTTLWDRDLLAGHLQTRDMVDAALAHVPALRAAGAELVVVLAHTGIGETQAVPMMENAAIPVAGVDGVDVVLAGHAHLLFPSAAYEGRPGLDVAAGRISGKPAVMAGSFGSHVGIVDLALSHGPDGWRIDGARSEARSTSTMPRAAADLFLADSRGIHRAARRSMAQVVGRTAEPLSTHFALVADAAALRLVGQAKRAHVAERLAGTAAAGLPVVATSAPYRAGGRGGPGNYTLIGAGQLARRHVADLYPFSNSLQAVEITGEIAADMLERAAALYRRIRPGVADQIVIDPAFPSYSFDALVGLTWRFDPSGASRYDSRGQLVDPVASRIRDLCLGGRPLRPTDRLVLATNSYRLATFEAQSGLTLRPVPLGPPRPAVHVVRDWVERQPGPVPIPPPGWRLDLPPGSSVLFDSSPHAQASELRGLRAQFCGTTSEGFSRFRVSPE